MSIQPIRKHVAPEIPDKLYFRIGDVARLCEVPAYVLRFWESEFPQLRPNKGGTGQRLYRKRDVAMALRIKLLLYDQGYTIPGARQVFKNEVKERETKAAPPAVSSNATASAQPQATALHAAAPERGEDVRRRGQLRTVRDELCALLAILEQPISAATEQATKPGSRVHAVRPRLALEPKQSPSTETLRLVSDTRAQGDLFASE